MKLRAKVLESQPHVVSGGNIVLVELYRTQTSPLVIESRPLGYAVLGVEENVLQQNQYFLGQFDQGLQRENMAGGWGIRVYDNKLADLGQATQSFNNYCGKGEIIEVGVRTEIPLNSQPSTIN